MKFIPNYNEGFPLDRTTIQTNFPILDVVGECRDHELDSLPPEIREHVHAMNSGAQNAGRSYGEDEYKKHNQTIPTKQIYIDGYSGIALQARRDPVLGWTCYGITFNPSKVIYGHNGRLIDEEQFSRAASVLDNSVFPLLKDPDDWVHMMPGQTEHSRAWWKLIEIPFHTRDVDGAILSAFSRAKHPEINVRPESQYRGESWTFKSANGELLIRIYRKDIQLRKKLKGKVSNDQPVLRIEVQLSGSKLEQYLPNATWKVIDGKRRLVSFRAKDLIAAHGDVVSKFSGVYTRVPTGCKEHDNKLARHMAWVEFKTELSVKDQIDHHVQRHLSGNTPASVANTRSTFGIAARKEAALMSKVKLADLFSHEAWCNQPVMCCDELEAKMEIKYGRVPSSRHVDEAYGWYYNR